MSTPDISMGFEATGDVAVEHGPLRLAVAEWAGKSPAEVTGDDVARFEAAQEGL
jgi:hypothetical protein